LFWNCPTVWLSGSGGTGEIPQPLFVLFELCLLCEDLVLPSYDSLLVCDDAEQCSKKRLKKPDQHG
jgi:hypothetical protein